MFLLGLLVFLILASAKLRIIDGYRVTIIKDILQSVEATDTSRPYLNLSNYNLAHIEDGAFKNLEMKNLLLDNNNIRNLHPFVFAPLKSLEYLSLDNNRLDDLRYAFGGLKNLMILSIQSNNIRTLEKASLYGIPNTTLVLTAGNQFDMILPEHYESRFTLLKLCMAGGIVESLEFFDENENTQTPDCCVRKIRIFEGSVLELRNEGIEVLKKNWYRLYGLPVKTLDLRYNKIARMSRSIFENLPQGLVSINLAHNKIKAVEKNIIRNRYLRELDLRGNNIRYVDDEAFAGTENINILIERGKFLPSSVGH